MGTHSDSDTGCRLGVLAFGDSITNGGGELQWGVALHSWALWVARGLGLPYSAYAVDGADIEHVVSEQIPSFTERAASPAGRYDLGCLYIGVNDVRGVNWDPERFASGFETALSFLAERCDRVLTVTAPLDMGRPRAGARKVSELNAIVRSAASRAGALVLELQHFHARNLLMPDHVHPTAFGQLAIAERVLELLARDGMEIRARPSRTIFYTATWRGQLRADATFVYRHLKVSARAAFVVARYRLTGTI